MTGPLDAKYIVKFTALTLFRRCIILCKLIVRIFARAALVGLCLAQTGCGSSEEGESAKVPHIGFMSMSASPPFIGALREGLSELGYVEGETIKIDWRLTDRRQELPGFAAEFVVVWRMNHANYWVLLRWDKWLIVYRIFRDVSTNGRATAAKMCQ